MKSISIRPFRKIYEFTFILSSILLLLISSLVSAQNIEEAIIELNDTVVNSRLRALLILHMVNDPQSVDLLITALKDCDREVRKYAADYLGEKGDSRAIEPLVNTLADKDSDVRLAAVYALGKLNWKPQNDKQKALYLLSKKEWGKCIELGDVAIEPLLIALFDIHSEVRSNAMVALGKMKAQQAVDPLIQYIKDHQKYDRCLAAITLGKIGDEQAVIPLIILMKIGAEHIRPCAAEALGELMDTRAVEHLIYTLEDENKYLRESSAIALGKLEDTIAVGPLISALNDKYIGVRVNVAEALGMIGDIRAIAPLILFLDDNNSDLRRNTAVALKKLKWKPQNNYQEVFYLLALGKRDACIEIGDMAVEPLFAALKNDDRKLRSSAATILGEIGNPLAIDPLIKSIADDSLIVRKNIADALIKLGDAQAIPKLVNLLTNWNISKEVSHALNRLGWRPESIEDTIHLLVAERNGNQLIDMWENTKSVLLNDVTSDDNNAIQNALFAFISIGNREIIPQLIETLNAKGIKTTAEAYLNCGNIELSESAKSWAIEHGYFIKHSGSNISVSWGSW